ncbi:MAG: leucine-rich repeat protein, partial [Clostridia bacterium]|nr:leucine-rich repeat protein [Clostridia bacterium]
MKKRILTIIITLAMAMGMISAATTTVFAADVSKKGTWGEYEEIGGEYKYTYANFSPFVESDRGTMENPYVIDSPSKLAGLAAMVNAYNKGSDVKLTDTYENTVTATNFFKNGESQYIKLTADLDLIGPGWIPIGTDLYNEFKGSFDGNGYTISGMAIGTADKANPECQYAGLFGYMTAGSIKNLSVSGLVNVSYSSKAYAGGIVGYAEAEANAITIENCSSTVSVTASSTGTAYAGGLMGNASSRVTITNCYSTGTVATTTYAGGLVGNASSGVTITNCYNTGTVEATTNAGGLLGIASNTTITNCYSAGGVSGTNAGGFIGNAGSTITIKDCYRIVGIEAIGTGSDSNGSTQELSQDQMQGSAGATDSSWENISIIAKYGSLVDALNKWVESNPSFTPWHIHEGGYPTLGVGETITTNTDGQTHTVTCGCNISTIKEHSGGTATCTEQAKCQHCGASYGEVGGHTPDAAGYTDNGNGTHSSTCAVCGDVTEEHAFDENGTCVCGINLFTVSGSTLTIDGTLGGKTEATEEDITVLVNKIKECVDGGITTITVTGEEPAVIEVYGLIMPAVSEAIYRLRDDESYYGKIDLILQDVTQIVDQEFNGAHALNCITLPEVTTVGDGAFYGCLYLKTITFGSVVTSINQKDTAVFHMVGEYVDGCDLVLNCGQMKAEYYTYRPDLENNMWFKPSRGGDVTWKSITLTHSYGDWVSNGDGTHTRTCANDNTHTENGDCSGGEATCTAPAVCIT